MFIRRKYKGEITMFGPSSSRKHKKNIFKKVAWLIFFVGILVGAIFFLIKKDIVNPEGDAMPQKEVQSLTKELSRFMVVPEEEPLIFTISDVDFLTQEQKFFENANNGDILFVFPEAEKAVVYSPKRERIINAGPVNFNGASMGQIPGTELQ